MGRIINPETGKPFVEVQPNNQIIHLREEIAYRLKSRYDAAQTTEQNQLHWVNADQLSPNAAHTLAIRSKLRSRARYESANSGYLKGILLSLANDFTGGGPTLQITDPRFTEDQQYIMENLYKIRAQSIKLRQKLWQLRWARSDSGEGFGVYYTNRKSKIRVRSSFRTIECDQFSHNNFTAKNKHEIDGLRFDPASGEPDRYFMLDNHPGETELFTTTPYNGKWINADNVIHWYRKERSWLRGIPETTSTLPLWALLRRYTLAVVQNAEIAADFTVLLKSMQLPAANPFTGEIRNPSGNDVQTWFDSFPIDRGLMTVLPSMYDMQQLDPKQPVSMYDTFVNNLVQEAARPLCVPRNMALGYSGGYNMASGTLDRQVYAGTITQDRLGCNEDILDKDLEQWWFEAVRLPGYLDDDVAATSRISDVVGRFSSLRETPPSHTWRWDEIEEHTDPVKVAHAMNLLHIGGHLSDIDIQEGKFNRSVEDHYRNLEKQQAMRSQLKMVVGQVEPTESTSINEDGEDE